MKPNKTKSYIFNIYVKTGFVYRLCPRGVMAKAMDSRIVRSEFEHQSRYYVHFGKGVNSLIILAMD